VSKHLVRQRDRYTQIGWW